MFQANDQAVLAARGLSPVRLVEAGPAADGRLDLKNFEKLPARDVPVSALTPGPYLRQSGTDGAHVRMLVDAADLAQLPPILVQENGWRVIDGAHRLQAARLRGDHTIRARFVDCTDFDALVLAIQANISHGLPLTKADRIAGARRVLLAHPDWSDRALADITGLSPNTIGALRTGPADGEHPGAKRLGRDGRRRPVTGSEGRRRAADYIGTHPEAPLRQVARETDVSLGTVHDVSSRLRRGMSPERSERRPPAVRGTAAPPERGVATVHPLPGAGAVPRRRNHTDAPPDWAQVSAKMANDPAIRYTEGGKEFLRWMAVHASAPDGWRQFVAAIPPHWLSVIAPIVDTIGTEWAQFAEQLKTKHEAAE